jgi:sulfonate transport system substrate-binding protein
MSTSDDVPAQLGFRRRRLVLVAAAVGAIGAAGGLGLVVHGRSQPAQGAALPAGVLRIGDQRGGVRALMTAAGVLHDAPYRIEWAEMPAAAPLLEALSAGAIDLGGVGGAPFAFAYSNGAPVKAVLGSRYATVDPESGKSSAILVPKASPLRSVADLRGRWLATIKGSAGQDTALRILQRAGVDPRQVHFVYLNNGDAKAALASGSIDAWSTWGTYVGIALTEGGNRILADAAGLNAPGRIAGVLAASDKTLDAKRPLVRDFLQRYLTARAWARTHREVYAAQIAKETGVPLAAARYGTATVLGTEFTPIDGDFLAEQRKTFDLYLRAGVIDAVPPLDKTGYDSEFNGLLGAQPLRQASN